MEYIFEITKKSGLPGVIVGFAYLAFSIFLFSISKDNELIALFRIIALILIILFLKSLIDTHNISLSEDAKFIFKPLKKDLEFSVKMGKEELSNKFVKRGKIVIINKKEYIFNALTEVELKVQGIKYKKSFTLYLDNKEVETIFNIAQSIKNKNPKNIDDSFLLIKYNENDPKVKEIVENLDSIMIGNRVVNLKEIAYAEICGYIVKESYNEHLESDINIFLKNGDKIKASLDDIKKVSKVKVYLPERRFELDGRTILFFILTLIFSLSAAVIPLLIVSIIMLIIDVLNFYTIKSVIKTFKNMER